MTKEEAYSVWMAAVESGSDTAHIYRSWYNFNDWWRARSAKPEEAASNWISTTERLPPEATLVLAVDSYNEMEIIGWVNDENSLGMFRDDGWVAKRYFEIEIVLWQFLPKVPGGKLTIDTTSTTQTTTTGDGIPYEYISSTSTAPDSFFGRVASAGGAKDTEK